jgi:hypothetical protein
MKAIELLNLRWHTALLKYALNMARFPIVRVFPHTIWELQTRKLHL